MRKMQKSEQQCVLRRRSPKEGPSPGGMKGGGDERSIEWSLRKSEVVVWIDNFKVARCCKARTKSDLAPGGENRMFLYIDVRYPAVPSG